MKTFYVYIMASKTGTLYVGFTSNILQRVYQHKQHLVPGYTDKYNVDRLIYYESFEDAFLAIGREKQLKKWSREKKIYLIDSENHKWNDLSEDWYE